MEVRLGDWILATCEGMHVIGMVHEMVEVFCPGMSVVRLLLVHERQVRHEDSGRGGVIGVHCSQPCLTEGGMCIAVEECVLQELHCHLGDGMLTFTYM